MSLSSKDCDGVLAVEDERVRLLLSHDADRMAGLLADDFTYIHSTGHVETKISYLSKLASDRVLYSSFVKSDLHNRIYGDAFLQNGLASIDLTIGGNPEKRLFRFTCMWVKTDQHWKTLLWQNTTYASR